MTTACTCRGDEAVTPTGMFWCEQHQCWKAQPWLKLCRTREKFRTAWASGRGPGQSFSNPVAPRMPNGPGMELKLLLSKLRVFAKGDCNCARHADVMDQWGPAMCRKRMNTILGWLEEEAKKRHLPFVRIIAARLVMSAIKRAERNLSSESS